MLRTATLVGLFALAHPGTCATRQLLLGDAERGREVFRSHGCVTCHSVNGEGGKKGADLTRMVERGFTPDRFSALLWNHAPAMWGELAQKGIAQEALSPQKVADLFAYLFALRSFEQRGNARRGKRVFRFNKCAHCHGINDPVDKAVAPVRSWPFLDHPILLAYRMWSHPRDWPGKRSARTSAPFPHLEAQDLSDLLAFLHSVQGRRASVSFLPASPREGMQIFVTSGCVSCHYGSDALEGRPTRYTLNDFAAAMWNHPPPAPPLRAAINEEEMRRLAGYLLSIQFIEEHGDTGRGRLLFEKKLCAICHENPSGRAPGRSDMAGRMTSFDMAAALWKHGLAMRESMRQNNIPWPRFNGDEMADLTAYLHGYEFKRRQPLTRPGPSAPVQ